tara:strand:- start:14841 stop:15851 length:1011 start_codon:yes stop_codon:yes gene_type:complete
MFLGETWNNCLAIYSSGLLLSEKYIEHLNLYVEHFPSGRNDTIWIDLIDGKLFSGSQFRVDRNCGKEHSFCDSSTSFLGSELGNDFVDQIIQEYNIFDKQEIIRTNEIIFNNTEFTKKYKDKSVLIISGGPSTKDVDWEKAKTDFTWTCNNFFNDKKFKEIDIDLITLAPNVDFVNNKEVNYYLNKGTNVAFEIERGDIQNEYFKMKKFVDMNKEKCSFFHTRYRGSPGVSLRMICYAIFLGAKDIYFVGIDGFKKDSASHAFEAGKGTPNWFKTYGPRFQDRQFVAYWDYILKLKEKYNFNLYNLGEGHPYNVSSEISKKHFPLNKGWSDSGDWQ